MDIAVFPQQLIIDALEASNLDPEWKPTTPVKPPLTDIEAIRRLMAKRVQKK